ncbi:MAG: ribonuclease III [candidate division SR1 bacterium CG_4_9_14_3_um_filter_40_9]|nr:MAG: ribonuclease III [candidate division SR1 bacterium CG_4_9_14_3_um_filter_40_9]
MLPQIVIDNQDKIINYVKGLGFPVDQIKDKNLLLQVFIHKSFSADYKNIYVHNERLEFLGDGILGAIINKFLFLKHPEMPESELTLYKIALVREENLALVARDIGLGQMIFLSKGEEKNDGRKKDVIISDCLESLLGYMYIDLGIEATEEFIEKYVYSKIENIQKESVKSYKTMIQEIVQKKYKVLPKYKDIEHQLDDKNNVIEYRSDIYVLDEKKSEGFGPNKKKAQEESAKNYYQQMTS